MSQTQTTEYAEIDNLIEELALTCAATFLPTPQPADKVPSPQLHWSVTLTGNGHTLVTSYTQGCGHVLGYKQPWFRKKTYEDRQRDRDMRRVCENGKLEPQPTRESSSVYKELRKCGGKQPAPLLRDVLWSLIMDSDALEYSFDEWASNLGYNPDSRKALEIFLLCQKNSTSLQKIVGGYTNLERLREAYRNY